MKRRLLQITVVVLLLILVGMLVFCGDIVEAGDKLVIQAAHYYKGSQMAPRLLLQLLRRQRTVQQENYLLPYDSDTYC